MPFRSNTCGSEKGSRYRLLHWDSEAGKGRASEDGLRVPVPIGLKNE